MKNKLRKILEKCLAFFARIVIRKTKSDIIAITGSVGKSSTKEAIFFVLKNRFGKLIWKNEGNLNEEIGVPLTILGFKKPIKWFLWPIVFIIVLYRVCCYLINPKLYPKVLILEMAASKQGDINYLLSIAKPKIAVITAVGLAHVEYFGSIENIAKEKSSLVKNLESNDWAILNQDNKYVREMAKITRAKVIYYHGQEFDSAERAAKAVGKIYGLNNKIMEKNLREIKPLKHRMNILKGINNTTIIDDTYNANSLSFARAINKLAEMKISKNAKKIAVMGDMLELGKFANQEHQKVYSLAKKVADIIITSGPNFRQISASNNFGNSSEAAEYLLNIIGEKDIILVKGSRGMKMERVVERINAKL